jgi:hypothetical protein
MLSKNIRYKESQEDGMPQDLSMKDFLCQYQGIVNKNKPTFFKIAGFPRWENVWSNVLCFFLNEEFHEMNGFLLNCFKECINLADLATSNVTARREEGTDAGNRIDIFVETDNYCFFIENKVGAELYNNLDDYMEYTKKNAKGKDGNFFGIVLSRLNGEEMRNKPIKLREEYTNKVHYVSYKDVLNTIRKNISQILFSADNLYLTFFVNFVENVSNVMEGKMDLNEEFYNLYLAHEAKIKNICHNYNSLVNYRRDIVLDYVKKLKDEYSGTSTKIFMWENYKAVMELPRLDDTTLVVEIRFILKGITLVVKAKTLESVHREKIMELLGNYKEQFCQKENEFVAEQEWKLNDMQKFENECFLILDTFIKNYKENYKNHNGA